jgi:cell division protein ZapE
MRGPLKRYRELVASAALAPDAAQEAAIERLQALEDALTRRKTGLFARKRTAPPKGVYLWGGVGRGKTVLMDLFFNNSHAHPRRRVHFHEFMAETHERVAAWRALPEKARRRHKGVNRKSVDDPIAPVAFDIASHARLLCFDEFHVSDIADAMILGRLFDALLANDVVVVATSNRHPDDLYPGGINRQLFLPFIETLKSRLDVIELVAARDYRLAQLSGAPVYYQPLGPAADAAMDAAWARFICGGREHADRIEVKGRVIKVARAARGAARFEFDELCARPLGASDYLAIARRYGTLFIDRIPRMSAGQRNEAKRFVILIDTLYEMKTKLVCSADAEPDELYNEGDGAFEFARAASRLMEMRSQNYLAAERAEEAEKIAAE